MLQLINKEIWSLEDRLAYHKSLLKKLVNRGGFALSGQQVKYGMIKNERSAVGINWDPGMGASEVIAAKSGRFVKLDSPATTSRLEIAAAATTVLAGWVELPAYANYNSSGLFTCSSTEGLDKPLFYPIGSLLGVVFRLPVSSGTYTAQMCGLSFDLAVASSIQGVALDTTVRDIVVVVGGDAANNAWVDIMVNVAKVSYTTGT